MTLLFIMAVLVAVEACWVLDPFTLPGGTLRWCWSCCGWGEEPHGYECNVCFGQGFRA